jgi:hypothetical protein
MNSEFNIDAAQGHSTANGYDSPDGANPVAFQWKIYRLIKN